MARRLVQVLRIGAVAHLPKVLSLLRLQDLLFVMKTKDPHGCFGKRYYFGKL